MGLLDQLEEGAMSFGGGLLDVGKNIGLGYLAYKAPAAFKAIMDQQNRARNQLERNQWTQANKGQVSVPFSQQQVQPMGNDQSAQRMVIQEDQQGSGLQGGSPMQQAMIMANSPDPIMRTQAAQLMRDISAPGEGGVTFQQFQGYDPQQRKDFQSYKGRGAKPQYFQQGTKGDPNMRTNAVRNPDGTVESYGNPYNQKATVQVNTGDQKTKGRVLNRAEKIELRLPLNGQYWDQGDGSMPKKMNSYSDFQVKSANYANMMSESGANMNRMEDEGYLPEATDNLGLYGVHSGVAAAFRGKKAREYEAYKKEWVVAHLRKESGATLTKEDMLQAEETYFYTTNDTAADRDRKRKARFRAEQGSVKQSGGAYEELFSENVDKNQRKATQSEKAKIKEIDDGEWEEVQY